MTPLFFPTVKSWIDFPKFKNGCGDHCYLSIGDSLPSAIFFQNNNLPSRVPATRDLPLVSYTIEDILSDVKALPSSLFNTSKTVKL
jgi:hypothetical protein